MLETVRLRVQMEWTLDIPKDRASSASVRSLVHYMDNAAMNVAASQSLASLVAGAVSWAPVQKEG